jgi:hypothetical protein
MMRRKKTYLLWSASGVLIGLGAATASAQTVQLSITYTPTSSDGGTWSAYAACDSGTDNIGLATFSIDVVGSHGVTVLSSYDKAPIGTASNGLPEGFDEFPSNGLGGVADYILASSSTVPGNGIAITASQSITYALEAAGMDLEVIQGFGKFAGSAGNLTWSFPALLADGTYIGSSGLLTVSPDFSIGSGIQTLDIVSNGRWAGQGNISYDTVFSGSVVVVPEPASLGSLALGGLALARRPRKKVCIR